MATLVLGTIGSVAGGPIGGFVGAAVGGVIDNMVLFPALFPQPDQDGQKIDGVNVTSGNEGTAMNWCVGPRNRLGGAVLWMSEIERVENEVGGKGGGPTVTNYDYYVSIAIAFCRADPQSVAAIEGVLANNTDIYRNGVVSGFYDSITLYDGTQTAPDPLMSGIIGDGMVPVYKKQVYVVIERLHLNKFGNVPPNFEAFVRQTVEMSAAEAIDTILARSGWEPEEYDTSNVSGCMLGYNIAGVTTTFDSLGPILATFAITMRDDGGVLRFSDRGREPIQSVVASEMMSVGDSSGNSGGEGGLELAERSNDEDRNGVICKYVSDENRLQPGSFPYRDQSKSGVDQFIVFDTPLVLDSATGEAVSKRIYNQFQAERTAFSVGLPQKYSHLSSGDVFSHDGHRQFFCVSVETDVDGKILVDGTSTSSSAFAQTGTATSVGGNPNDPPELPDLFSVVFELPAMIDDHVGRVIVLFCSTAIEADRDFNGALMLTSSSGTTFVNSAGVFRPMCGGPVIVLPSNNADATKIDKTSSIIVYSRYFAPTSCTEDELLSGERNVAAVKTPDGWEVFAYKNSTALGDNQYRLDYLARGLRGTESRIGSHAPGSHCVFISGNSSNFGVWDAGIESIGRRHFKIVPNGGSEQTVESFTQTVTAESSSCFAPSHLAARRVHTGTGSDEDVEITWRRRTKRIIDPFGSGEAFSSDENPETYEIELRINGPLSPLLRTVVVHEPRYVYDQATRDFDAANNTFSWTEGDQIRIVVRQVGGVSGRGKSSTIFIEPRS